MDTTDIPFAFSVTPYDVFVKEYSALLDALNGVSSALNGCIACMAWHDMA